MCVAVLFSVPHIEVRRIDRGLAGIGRRPGRIGRFKRQLGGFIGSEALALTADQPRNITARQS